MEGFVDMAFCATKGQRLLDISIPLASCYINRINRIRSREKICISVLYYPEQNTDLFIFLH